MKTTLHTICLLILCVTLSSWGSKGHRRISQNMANGLPASMTFFKPGWTGYVMNHASDADYRKDVDPNESPRHYIDIDNYPVFIQTGRIPQTFDSLTAAYGYGFVMDQGILPWATLTTLDSLRECFRREDWNGSAMFAADLGHYVGDGHMPLHITANYNGQLTGQSGIHSRYESSMISRYESQLVYPVDTAGYVENPAEFVFGYLYHNYRYVDSILLADTYAATAGSIGSDAYYAALWARTGDFTKGMMKHGSEALARLIYTAWVDAGKPVLYPNGGEDPGSVSGIRTSVVFPNPARERILITLETPVDGTRLHTLIAGMDGTLRSIAPRVTPAEGVQKLEWDISGFPAGVYVLRLMADGAILHRRFVVAP